MVYRRLNKFIVNDAFLVNVDSLYQRQIIDLHVQTYRLQRTNLSLSSFKVLNRFDFCFRKRLRRISFMIYNTNNGVYVY